MKRNNDPIQIKQLLATPFVLAIRCYQYCISPFLPSSCRFYPSCSHYAVEAFEKYGPVKGFWLATKRIVKCHPFHPGGYDPVP